MRGHYRKPPEESIYWTNGERIQNTVQRAQTIFQQRKVQKQYHSFNLRLESKGKQYFT